MKKGAYESPELIKVGNVKDLTLGGTGNYTDSGAAGSFDPYRPTSERYVGNVDVADDTKK